jgi:hypothetical protein
MIAFFCSGVLLLTSKNAVKTKTGEHCKGEQHLSGPDHAALARGNSSVVLALRGCGRVEVQIVTAAFDVV